ncbi:2-keto-4-pentenoate hydratase [Comamonas badia]|uniref:2-keto-4-pentenoate hydratase n=1 Tax=Comamonas badia TaxID=265291 RepID=UPI000464D04F|nr:fumarylacetoacetate hydrolase [Comamonas badia]
MVVQKTFFALLMGVGLIAGAQAACLTQAQVQTMADDYFAKKPTPNFAAQSDKDAACTRARFNKLLAAHYGKVVGYKAGLTNPATQKRFNTSQPTWGVLYDGIIQPNGFSTVPNFGARPLFEADMLVRVKDAGINNARTPEEVMQHIDQVIPFIELPDLIVEAPPKLNGAAINAINVGARLGVAGTPMPVPADRMDRFVMLAQLANMQIKVADQTGKQIGAGKGSDILEHPLNAVVWLTQALHKEHLRMKPGDLISLGSFSALMPPKPGLSVTVSYEGLAGAQPVTVHFK